MRAAVRAYIATDPDPVVVVTKLDNMFTLYETSQLVTLVYMVIDASNDALTVVSAGHLPPIMIDADGVSAPIWGRISPPLGVGGVPRIATTVPMPPGATVVAYTDGLVERRGEDIDLGIERVVSAVASFGSGNLLNHLDELASQTHDTHDDDVTVLALRRDRVPEPS